MVQSRAEQSGIHGSPRTNPVLCPTIRGKSGWVGVYLDGDVDWGELAELLRDSYRLTAPKRLIGIGNSIGVR